VRYEQVEGGAVVVIALISKSKILLVKNLDHPEPKWKLIAETVKPGESILNTLKYGLEEEAGLENIKTELGQDGKIAKFTDPRIIKVVEFGEPEYLEKVRVKHYRHFYGVLASDELLNSLTGERRHTEENDGNGGTEVEALETGTFPISMIGDMPGLLRQHSELIRSIPERVEREIK
jgi:ADP-ribose pyrophosphatase YjhB (NUDIX family)